MSDFTSGCSGCCRSRACPSEEWPRPGNSQSRLDEGLVAEYQLTDVRFLVYRQSAAWQILANIVPSFRGAMQKIFGKRSDSKVIVPRCPSVWKNGKCMADFAFGDLPQDSRLPEESLIERGSLS